ncbi:MAG: rhomboid family intramembrane serine protease [Pirellulales bacterium]
MSNPNESESFVLDTTEHRAANPAEQLAYFVQSLHQFTPRLVVTPVLIAINIGLLVAALVASRQGFEPNSGLLEKWGANYGPATMNGQWWRLATCMFLHGSILHVLLNMWVLLDFGRLVERLTGSVGFAIAYVVTGLAGSLASLAWNPQVLSVGASGAVFGIGGVLLGWIVLRRDSIPPAVLAHLRNSIGGFLVYNLLNAFRGGNIDHAAHAGGLAAGVVCGLLLSQPLDVDALGRRWWKNALTAIVGVAGLAGAAAFLPPAPPPPVDVEAEFQAFLNSEKQALATFQKMIEDSQAGRLSNADFARQLDEQLLPAWVTTRVRLEKLQSENRANQTLVTRLIAYANQRESAWRTFSQGAREDDQKKIDEAVSKWNAADEAARRVSDP